MGIRPFVTLGYSLFLMVRPGAWGAAAGPPHGGHRKAVAPGVKGWSASAMATSLARRASRDRRGSREPSREREFTIEEEGEWVVWDDSLASRIELADMKEKWDKKCALGR